jgi:hypothetical protein
VTPWLALSATLLCLALADPPAPQPLHRYWPTFPRPKTILTVKEVRTVDEAFVLQSVAGLPARRATARALLGQARTALGQHNYRQAFLAGKNAARVLGVIH